MGWDYEYLRGKLEAEIRKRYPEATHIYFDAVGYVYGRPSEGWHKGTAAVDLKGKIMKISFDYEVRSFLNREYGSPFVDYKISKIKNIKVCDVAV